MVGFLFSAAKSGKPSSFRDNYPTKVRAHLACHWTLRLRAFLRTGGARPLNFEALHPIDSGQQPAKLAADDGGIAVRTDAGDVDIDRRAAVRARLRGDGPRLARLRQRRALKNPILCPVPWFGFTADHIPAGVGVVVGGVGVDTDGDGVEASAADRAGDDGTGARQFAQHVAPSPFPVGGDLGLLLLPDERGHHALAERRLERRPRLEDGEEQSLHLCEEHVLVERRVVRADGDDAAELAIDAITVDIRRPGARHQLSIPLPAWTMEGAALGREVSLAVGCLAVAKPAGQVLEALNQADT